MFLMTLLHRSKVSVDDALNLKRFDGAKRWNDWNVEQLLSHHKTSLRLASLETQLNDIAGTKRIYCGDDFCLAGPNRWPACRG